MAQTTSDSILGVIRKEP